MSRFLATEEEVREQVEFDNNPRDVTDPAQRTELANAKRFIERHGKRLRYVPQWRKFIYHVGTHWQIDNGCVVEALARDIVEEVWWQVEQNIRQADRAEAAAMLAFAKATASAKGIEHLLRLAQSEPRVPIQPEELDKNPWLLNVQNGTIDLRTGKRRPHDKNEYITKLAPVVHSERATSTLWENFVAEIMAGDMELVGFLQRLVGYWLTGSVQEHVLPIFHGGGANGKSVFLGTIEAMLGTDYSMHAPPDLLMVKRHESHPTERADLFGKRLVTCVETEAGKRLAESLVKELTGGDPIRARRMREDHWQFLPSHKLVIASNARPVVYGTDNGIWRRLRLVPFTVTIPEERQDKTLGERLKREASGILTWAIRGCLAWQAGGLQEPSRVLLATDQYRDEQDILAEFFDENCTLGTNQQVASGKLFESYCKWCVANGHDPDNSTVFGRKLSERGFPAKKDGSGIKLRLGIGLKFDSSAY